MIINLIRTDVPLARPYSRNLLTFDLLLIKSVNPENKLLMTTIKPAGRPILEILKLKMFLL